MDLCSLWYRVLGPPIRVGVPAEVALIELVHTSPVFIQKTCLAGLDRRGKPAPVDDVADSDRATINF